MGQAPKAFEILLRAVASSMCERELEHIRSLASTHDTEQLERLDRAIAARRRELAGLIEPTPPTGPRGTD